MIGSVEARGMTDVRDVVRNPGIASRATNIGVPTVWRIGSIV
jgi:hypothetical protein